jgi:hypothetical protein
MVTNEAVMEMAQKLRMAQLVIVILLVIVVVLLVYYTSVQAARR